MILFSFLFFPLRIHTLFPPKSKEDVFSRFGLVLSKSLPAGLVYLFTFVHVHVNTKNMKQMSDLMNFVLTVLHYPLLLPLPSLLPPPPPNRLFRLALVFLFCLSG